MLTVEDILMAKGPDVIVGSPTTTVREAARLMAEAKVGSIVIKHNGHAAGMFTERDLLCRVVAQGKDPATTPLSEVMTSPILSVSLADTVVDCGATMMRTHIRHLAVIEDDSLVGVLSFRDVLTAELTQSRQALEELHTGHA
jgi:CBS domain-containing protein